MVLTYDQVIVRIATTSTSSTLKMPANLTQILNFKVNFHKEFELFFFIVPTMVDPLTLYRSLCTFVYNQENMLLEVSQVLLAYLFEFIIFSDHFDLILN